MGDADKREMGGGGWTGLVDGAGSGALVRRARTAAVTREGRLGLGEWGIIIIIKRTSRAPIYHTRWEHRALYNNTHTHTHSVSDEGTGRDVKKQFRNNY